MGISLTNMKNSKKISTARPGEKARERYESNTEGPQYSQGKRFNSEEDGVILRFNTVHGENQPEREAGKLSRDTGQSVDLLEEME